MNLAVAVSPDLGPARRLPLLDALRGYAILLVIFYHAGGAVGWTNWIHAEAGVDVFLLVSGFVLARSAASLTAREFWTRRFFRLYPKYWFALVLFVALEWRYYNHTHTWPDLLWHATGLHAIVSADYFSSINDSFWFVSLIIVLYAAFWLLRKYLGDPLALAGWGMLLSAAACGYFALTGNNGGIIQFASRIPAFFIGLIVSRCWTAPTLLLRPSWPFWLGAAGLLAAYLFKGFVVYYPVLALGLIAPVVFAFQAFHRFALGRAVFLVLGVLGTFSYEIFLLHQPLIRDYCHSLLQLFHPIDPDHIPVWLRLSSGLAFTGIGVCAIFLVEKIWARVAPSARRKFFAAAGLLSSAAALWPLEVYAWQQGRLRFAAARAAVHEQIVHHSDYAGYPGPVRLRVNLPRTVSAIGSPLVVTGRTGAGDIVHVVCVGPDRYIFSLDHWGAPVRNSPILSLRADQPHEIVLSLGSLLPADIGGAYAALRNNLFVSVDGAAVLSLAQNFYPSFPADCRFGLNPVGGSTALAAYEGGIIARENVPPSQILFSLAAHSSLRWVYFKD